MESIRIKKKKETIRCPPCGAKVEFTDEFCFCCGKLLFFNETYDAIADEEDM